MDPVQYVRESVENNVRFSEILKTLRASESFDFRAIMLVYTLRQALGMSISESQEIIARLDADLQPLHSERDLDETADRQFAPYRRST